VKIQSTCVYFIILVAPCMSWRDHYSKGKRSENGMKEPALASTSGNLHSTQKR
jgi:hypothetical protein